MMCLTAAKVQKLQAAIEQLEDLVEEGSASCHSRQAALAAANPPLFADIQVCTGCRTHLCGHGTYACLQRPDGPLLVQGWGRPLHVLAALLADVEPVVRPGTWQGPWCMVGMGVTSVVLDLHAASPGCDASCASDKGLHPGHDHQKHSACTTS